MKLRQVLVNNLPSVCVTQAEVEKELVALSEERDAVASNHSRSCENEAFSSVSKDEVDSFDAFVREVLLPRHLKEMANLSDRLQRELAAVKAAARTEVKL